MTADALFHEGEESLLNDAEAFDTHLLHGGGASFEFSREHRELAAVFRLLHEVFGSAHPGDRALPSAVEPRWPQSLARFRIVSVLGQGGFGTVYRAYDEVLRRDVAIKVISGQRPESSSLSDCHLAEARAVARLNHANIVPLYEIQQDDESLYLISAYCDGPTLADWHHQHPGPVSPHFAAEIIYQLADAASHAHSRGLVHRDIKPSNVLLTPSEDRDAILHFAPRLTDFGLVCDLHESPAAVPSRRLAGTIEYMAPEQMVEMMTWSFPATETTW